LEHLQLACNELKDENEFAIINEYGYNAYRYTTALMSKMFVNFLIRLHFIFSAKISRFQQKNDLDRICNTFYISYRNIHDISSMSNYIIYHMHLCNDY